MRKGVFTVIGVSVFLLFGYIASTVIKSGPSAAAARKTYSAILYIGGMGGHFAKVEATIDPDNVEEPLKINSLGRVIIGSKELR